MTLEDKARIQSLWNRCARLQGLLPDGPALLAEVEWLISIVEQTRPNAYWATLRDKKNFDRILSLAKGRK